MEHSTRTTGEALGYLLKKWVLFNRKNNYNNSLIYRSLGVLRKLLLETLQSHAQNVRSSLIHFPHARTSVTKNLILITHPCQRVLIPYKTSRQTCRPTDQATVRTAASSSCRGIPSEKEAENQFVTHVTCFIFRIKYKFSFFDFLHTVPHNGPNPLRTPCVHVRDDQRERERERERETWDHDRSA